MAILFPKSVDKNDILSPLEIQKNEDEERRIFLEKIEYTVSEVCNQENSFKEICNSMPLLIRQGRNRNLYLGYFMGILDKIKFGLYNGINNTYFKRDKKIYEYDMNGMTKDRVRYNTEQSLRDHDIKDATELESLIQNAVDNWYKTRNNRQDIANTLDLDLL